MTAQSAVFHCKLCPNKGTDREIRGVGARMAAYRVCSSCDFWLMCLGTRCSATKTYVLLDDPTGTVHVTRRLWLMGTIPDAFRDRMPDNAVFAPPA
ncbi:hypothetical protein AB0G85_33675 [Streptomyces sioyaensis]|uniref:hypothetical protein n=1 Tax=Streptomyces sioyaensis TaxID=67364 RepID=UPI0033F93C01